MCKIKKFIKDYFGMSPIEFYNSLNLEYDDDVYRLFSCSSDDELFNKYPNIYKYGLSSAHCKDTRSVYDFLLNLACSWLIEDYIRIMLENSGLKIQLNGCDSKRSFKTKKVTTEPDFIVFIENTWVPVELQCNYFSTWTTDNGIYLRDNKYDNLYNKGECFLFVDMVKWQYCLFDFSKETTYITRLTTDESPLHKPTTLLSTAEKVMKGVSAENLYRDLYNHLY